MRRIWLTLLLLPGLACGCSETKPPPARPISLSPTVKVVQAQYRTVKRTVEQPGVISATAHCPLCEGFRLRPEVEC